MVQISPSTEGLFPQEGHGAAPHSFPDLFVCYMHPDIHPNIHPPLFPHPLFFSGKTSRVGTSGTGADGGHRYPLMCFVDRNAH